MKESRLEQKRSKNRVKTEVCEISQPLRNRHFAAKPVRSLRPLYAKIFAAAKPLLAHECHFAAQEPPFRSCETTAKLLSVKIPNFAAKAPFRRLRNQLLAHECRKNSQFSQPKPHSAGSFSIAKPLFGTRVPFGSPVHSFHSCEMSSEITFRLRNGLRKCHFAAK
uniref:Uncharacterized protein n=1 Tax=Vitis vinifera TaxID=29760 RepID=A5BBN6_VITVI|nr:hypothetical protein VITISV_022013 [Vitis vinifera]